MSHENLLHGTFVGGEQSMLHENFLRGTFVDGEQSMSHEHLLHGTFVEGSGVCHMRASHAAPLSRGAEHVT